MEKVIYTEEEKERVMKLAQEFLNEKTEEEKIKAEKKRRMKTGKKALLSTFALGIAMIIFSMVMVFLERDSTTLNIITTAGVSILPLMFGIYEFNSTKVNLKHMEQNYIENYDEKNNIY